MQQQSISWQSLADRRLRVEILPPQRPFEVKATSTLNRQDRIEKEPSARLERSSHRQQLQTTLARALGTCEIESVDLVTDVCAQVRRASTANFQLVELQWQSAFKLALQPLADRYIIYLVLAGTLHPRREYHQDETGAASAAIYSPGCAIETISSQSGQALLLTIERTVLETTASKLLARPIDRPLVFQPNIDLTGDVGASLKQFVKFLWETAAASTDKTGDFSSLLLQKLEQAFLDCAIEGLPHNYSDELLYRTDGALARHVRKAQAFIESHLGEKIELGDIAAATQICPRLLQKAFAICCDRSPMRFVMEMRLQRIRQELERGNSTTKIVDVMMNYGFTQGGKFAKEYQQLFGEKPSDTLKRSLQICQQHPPLWREIDDDLSSQIKGGREWGWRPARLIPSCPDVWTGATPILKKISSLGAE